MGFVRVCLRVGLGFLWGLFRVYVVLVWGLVQGCFKVYWGLFRVGFRRGLRFLQGFLMVRFRVYLGLT